MEKKVVWEEGDEKTEDGGHSDARSLERPRTSRESTTTPRVVIISND